MEEYKKCIETLRKHPRIITFMNVVNQCITKGCYILFLGLIIYFIWKKDCGIIRVILVDGVSFILLSIFRDVVNFPRPYEVLEIKPLIHKETKGHSFPSRHVFCIYIIAMTFLSVCLPVGIILLILGGILGAIRVLTGVHFLTDVVVGAIAGIVMGYVGFFVF